MLKLVLFLFSILLGSNIYANECALDDENATQCEIDSQNPPTFLHTFINKEGKEILDYAKCIKEDALSVDSKNYTLINCSLIEKNEDTGNLLTEGIIIDERIKEVVIADSEEQNNDVVLTFAGKVVIKEGVNFNAPNLIIKILNATENNAQLIVDKNSRLNIKSIIIQNSSNPAIIVNRCNSEKNKKVMKEDIKDVLNLENGIFVTNGDDWLLGDEYRGDIICGSDVENKETQDESKNMLDEEVVEENEEGNLDSNEILDSNEVNEMNNMNEDSVENLEEIKFLIVDKENFDVANKKCKNDIGCLEENLSQYDGIIGNKFASKNTNYNIYIVNLGNEELNLKCNITDYNGNNKEEEYSFSELYKAVQFKFPISSYKAKLSCSSKNMEKETNEIHSIPAKIMLNAEFDDPNMLKAGDIKLKTKDAKALILEGEVDAGFSDALIAYEGDINFNYKNKCSNKNNSNGIQIKEPLKIDFKNGVSATEYVELNIKKVIEGNLNIRFSNENICKDSKCIGANTSNDISVIPANFAIITDIISENKVIYYGQLNDRNNFKFNPILNLKLAAIDNNGNDIDINNDCNYGNTKLSLSTSKLIDFKRKSPDKIGREIKIFNDEFVNSVADINVYFGVSKFKDENDDIREMKQNDLMEPLEIGLNDFVFNITYTNNNKTYEYNDTEIYDRLEMQNTNEELVPSSVLIARGKLQIDNEEGYVFDDVNAKAKYQIYCKTCDTKILEKYLETDGLIISEANWYVNTKHPSDFYLEDKFIKTNLKIKNSKKSIDGIQEIILVGNKTGENNIVINQQYGGFAPYLNYNEKYNNVYLSNYFVINLLKK